MPRLHSSSCELVSAGADSTLRLFNSAIESQNREFSQKPILKRYGMVRRNEKLPVVIDFDFVETRQRDWGNMITAHKDHSNVYVWRYRHRVVTELVLRQPDWPTNVMAHSLDSRTHSTAVVISACGNFACVGSKGGMIYCYNLQSGIARGSLPKQRDTGKKKSSRDSRGPVSSVMEAWKAIGANDDKWSKAGALSTDNKKEKEEEKRRRKMEAAALKSESEGHTAEISGLCMDLMGSTLVSCGHDGQVIFWNFMQHTVRHRIKLNCQLRYVVHSCTV